MIEDHPSEKFRDTNTGLRRDILLIFKTWHNEPLSSERIKELLKTKGRSVKMDTLYDNLETLVRADILTKRLMSSTGQRGRPPYFYELNRSAVYTQFKLLEDLLDACGFDPIFCDESGNAYVAKSVCMVPDGALLLPGFERVRSIRNAFDGGELATSIKRAEPEDFEKTWQLERFIKKLEERCKTDSAAYIKYRKDKEYQRLVEFCRRHRMVIPAKEKIVRQRITIHGTGPLIFHSGKDSTSEEENPENEKKIQ